MSKINKLGKSTFVIAILSLILVAVLSFGGTYAYFSAKSGPVSGDITMGTLSLAFKDGTSAVTELSDIEIAQPNQEILDKTYTLDLSASTIKSYVRVKITAELTGVDYTTNTPSGDSHITAATIFTITTNSGWFRHTDGYLYMGTAADAAASTVAAAGTQTLDVNIRVNKEVGEDGSTFFMGKTGTYTITVEAIQADYVDGVTSTTTISALADAWDAIVSVKA